MKITSHDSRHACVSQLAELELDEDDAAALLGHTSGRITKAIYTHAFAVTSVRSASGRR